MPEEQTKTSAATGMSSGQERVPELEPRQLELLTDIVYRLIRDELLLARERRGETTGRDWR